MQFLKPILAATLAMAVVPALIAAKNSVSPAFQPEEAGIYKIDTGHSAVIFGIKHMDVSNTYGRFNDFEGQYVLSDKEGESSLEITVDAKSVDTHSEKRDNHLRDPDFLSVKEFPKITFKSSKFEKKDDNTYAVTGVLDLHGREKVITADMDLVGARDTGERMGFRSGLEARFSINRRDFGIDTYPDEALSNEITFIVALEGIRQGDE